MDETPLAALLRIHCEQTGDTLASVAARGGLSRQTLSELINKGRAFPRPATLEGLAKGLGLPYEAVREAAVRGIVGEDVDGPRRLVTALMAYAEGLTDAQLEVVLATARAVKKLPTSA